MHLPFYLPHTYYYTLAHTNTHATHTHTRPCHTHTNTHTNMPIPQTHKHTHYATHTHAQTGLVPLAVTLGSYFSHHFYKAYMCMYVHMKIAFVTIFVTHTHTNTYTHTDRACTTCSDLFLTPFSQSIHVHECTHVHSYSLCTIFITHTHKHTYTVCVNKKLTQRNFLRYVRA